MRRINVLDDVTSNKIAAGEVVERPSSVVKELIENSIDASSQNILIEIEEGGKDLIRIVDDGDGIHPEDIPKAFLTHATSKIKQAEDIFAINTLGFRGEALPSIASVSKVSLKSRTKDSEIGKEIKIEGGEILSINDFGMNKGTIITSTDLFYNVPARKKFLKSTSRESSLITDIVNRMALCNPKISFRLINSKKTILHTFGNGNTLDVIRSIYGKNIANELIYFENHSDTVSMYGYIGRESISKASKKDGSIFVNGRYIKNAMLSVAVENAFKSFSTVNKHPVYMLFLDIYPELLDVNIHPTKAEIKFENERSLFKFVFDTIHSAFKKDVMDTFSLPEEEKYEEEKHETLNLFEPTNYEIKKEEDLKENLKNDFNVGNLNNFEMPEEIEKPNPLTKSSKLTSGISSLEYESQEQSETSTAVLEIPVDLKPLNSNEKVTEDVLKIACPNICSNEQKMPLSENKLPKFPILKIIGQFNKTYILGESNDELYLIDQHAAHEKILFEKYISEIENSIVLVQPLLVPLVIELSLSDYSYFEENEEVFKDAGFIVSSFGESSVVLKEVPYFLNKTNSKSLFLEILQNLKKLGSGKTIEVKYNKIATMACKSAVKAHDELNIDEMESLIEDLRFIENPFHCPHGRPTIIKMSLNEIEKRFKRIQ